MLKGIMTTLHNEFFYKGQNFEYGSENKKDQYVIYCYSNKEKTGFILNADDSLKNLYIPFTFIHSKTLNKCSCIIKNCIINK